MQINVYVKKGNQSDLEDVVVLTNKKPKEAELNIEKATKQVIGLKVTNKSLKSEIKRERYIFKTIKHGEGI